MKCSFQSEHGIAYLKPVQYNCPPVSVLAFFRRMGLITTVVGNYPKIGPGTKAPSLRNAISQFDYGRIGMQDLRDIEDQVTEEVIKEQIDAGIDLVTDGQVRWDDGQTYLARGIKGFTINGLIRYFDSNTYYRHPIASSNLAWEAPITVQGFVFASSHSVNPVKAVVTGPYTLARLSQLGAYKDLRSLTLDLAGVLNQEAIALQEAGASLIQFDEPAILKHKEDFTLLREASEILTNGIRTKTEICTYFRDVSGLTPELFKLPFDVFPPHSQAPGQPIFFRIRKKRLLFCLKSSNHHNFYVYASYTTRIRTLPDGL